jgi:hypothetical protein
MPRRNTKKAQLELALDGPFTREASLALDQAVAAQDARRERARRRAAFVSYRLMSTLNHRDGARMELRSRTNTPDRRRELEARIAALHEEQDEFEAELTRLAEVISA